MSMAWVRSLGDIGLIKDVSAALLAPNAWSDARNVVFQDGVVRKITGSRKLCDLTALVNAIFPCSSPSGSYWALFTPTAAYGLTGTTEADITRASGSYTGAIYDYWNGGSLNGIPVFNNGVDIPQMWSPTALATKLVDLTNWQSAVRAKVIRPFKNFLIALDVSVSGVRNPRLVKWSHPAAPGTIPISWDETDATKDAGEFPLSEGEDTIIDCLPLGNANAIYTDTATWAQTLSGAFTIFNFDCRFGSVGLLAQDCACKFMKQHFVVTRDDFVVHDLTNVQSVADARIRKWVFANMSKDNYSMSMTFPISAQREIWVVFPTSGSGTLNMAAIWNWSTGVWSLREMDQPNLRAFSQSMYNIPAAVDTYDSTSGDYTTDTEPYGDTFVGASSESVVFNSGLGLHTFDDTLYQDNGTSYRSYIERISIPLIPGENGVAAYDAEHHKLYCEVWPIIEAAAGTTIDVYIGVQDFPDQTVTWTQLSSFVVGTTKKIDGYAVGSGVYLSIRFEETSGAAWSLKSYGIDVTVLGVF